MAAVAIVENRQAKPFADPSLQKLRSAVGWVQGKPVLMSGMSPPPALCNRIEAWISTLKSRLSCGANDAKLKAVELAKLTSAFPQQGQDQVSSGLRVATYFDALDGLPAWAVRDALQLVVNGQTSFGRPWGPGPIEFADLVKQVLRPLKDDMRDLLTIQQTAPLDAAPSPDEHSRISKGFDGLRASFGPRTSHQVYEDAMMGLQSRALEKGIDFEAALASIPDAKPRSGTFSKVPPPSTEAEAA